MIGLVDEKVLRDNNISILKSEKDCTVYKMQDVSGEGTMTWYKVFPGIYLSYNDFHMETCCSAFKRETDILTIDHCRQGRIEWELTKNRYMYLQEGDLFINSKDYQAVGFGFPIKHYHGITVIIYINEALHFEKSILEEFSIDLKSLHKAFTSGEGILFMRAMASIEHIFSELYTVSPEIRNHYFKIKVLELLLFLSAFEMPMQGSERPYLPKNQVQKAKAIMKYMTDHIDEHFTLEELSLRFKVSLTTMKSSFKGVYGTSIYSYMRMHRMHIAAKMLKENDERITTIASKVGYSNPSKFSAAFKDIIGISPKDYRKQMP
ncbi:AraC family transcriptional regulator [Natranaerovirga hydrolytica]|uniref:AraC family transcriptional regulator n=1 Tax=Natranaerovirga hydrolytica TaxID=680378 RepID=A0A4R1MZG7_9FIRM|nr:AraC family transcriptional regulator [Natranaerovirga hydrolytica]TCK98727.1 AraC family transcriptional regulator [Natranaerovirga hydrolytica]